MPRSILAALDQIPFGEITTAAFLRALQAGLSAEVPLTTGDSPREHQEAVWAAKGRFLWTGPIPDAVGHYVVANPYSTRRIELDRQSLRNGLGLKNSEISDISTVFCEVDEAPDGGRMSLEAQARVYDAIETETGLRFSALVLSGDTRHGAREAAGLKDYVEVVPGKSMHAWISIKGAPHTPENESLRLRAASALCVLAGADPAVRDIARKARLGGTAAREGLQARIQSCLRAEVISYDLLDVVTRLEGAVAARGQVVSVVFEALQVAAQCRTRAKSWRKAWADGRVGGDEADGAAEALEQIALEVRQRGSVLPSNRSFMAILGTPKGQVTVVTQSGSTRSISTGHADGWDASTTILTHTSGREGTASSLWSSMCRGYRVPDVHCVGHADAHASAYLTEWHGTFTIHCPSCGKIRSGSASNQGTRPSGLIDLIESDDIVIASAIQPRPLQPVIRGMTQAELEAQAAATIRLADESRAAYAARPQTIAHHLHEGFLASAPEVLELVAEEVRLHDSVYQLAGLEADLLGDSSECPSYSHIGDIGSNSDIPPHLMELARERFEEVAQTCKRGPLACTPLPAGRLRMVRLACRARGCPECGPRGRRAERAAIAASVKGLGPEWRCAQLLVLGDEKQLRRWVGESKDRVVLTVKINAIDDVTLLAWAHGQTLSTRTRARLGDEHPVAIWAETLADLIQDGVQPGERQRAVSGTPWITRQINAIKKELLQVRKRENVVKKCFITKAKSSEARARVMDEIEGHAFLASESGSVRTRLGEIAEIGVDLEGAGYRLATMDELLSACRKAKIFRGQAHRSTRSDEDVLEDILSNFDLDLDDEDPASKKRTAS